MFEAEKRATTFGDLPDCLTSWSWEHFEAIRPLEPGSCNQMKISVKKSITVYAF